MSTLIVMIFIGALIGWVTNFIAIKLLFRPYKAINILGFKIQGVIPKRKKDLAVSIAKTIEEELISIKDITNTINSMELEGEIEKIAEKIAGDKLKEEIVSKFPMAAMFLNESLMNKIKSYIVKVIDDNKEELVEIIINKIETEVNFQELVKSKIEEFSLEEMEKIVFSIAKTELKHIELIGGVLGALIGLCQYAIIQIIYKG